MAPLREDNKAAKRQRIFAAARRQFEKRGFEQTTFRSIAAEAGVGLGTVHVYAESKHGLLNEVWREATLPVIERALDDAAGKPLLAGALALFEPLLRAYAAAPALAKVVIKELPWLEGRAAQQHLPDLQRFLGALAALVVEGQKAGRIAARVEPALAAGVLFSIYYSACLQLVVPFGTPNVEQVVADLRARLQLVTGGWRAGT